MKDSLSKARVKAFLASTNENKAQEVLLLCHSLKVTMPFPVLEHYARISVNISP